MTKAEKRIYADKTEEWDMRPNTPRILSSDHQFHPERDASPEKKTGVTTPSTNATLSAHLPTTAKERKDIPLARGLLDYFPDSLAEVAELSRIGNDQHNPGEPMHWAKEKSIDHADSLMRHMVDRGLYDTEGVAHSTKVAWRALAMRQIEIEAERGDPEAIRQMKENGRWDK